MYTKGGGQTGELKHTSLIPKESICPEYSKGAEKNLWRSFEMTLPNSKLQVRGETIINKVK